jgi:hypothetical protein
MTRNSSLVYALALIAGCAQTPDDRDPNDPQLPIDVPTCPTDAVDDNLARINALEVVEVSGMIVQYPEGSMNCYGICPGFEDEVAEAECDAAEKVAAIAIVAEAADVEPVENFDSEVVDADLARLAALEVVDVERFVEAIPENNPECYNMPCQEDIEAADLANRERQATLRAIVEGAEQVCGSDGSGY